jgi:heme-degrading monooxygenase HmoA
MVARVTLAEIDVVRMSISSAVRLYRESVLPAQHDQPGYEGGYVLATPEGKALVMTFWASAEDAEAGLASGFYGEQVQKFATVYRAQPGRDLYDVVLADPPPHGGLEQAPAASGSAPAQLG